ncbi:MAG: hypothetical protein WCT19_03410 [Candidatus Paceibacterota bacterium]|jgi:hypothetical protein
MFTLIVLFYISFACIAILVALKTAETKGYNTKILPALRNKYDAKLEALAVKMKNFVAIFNRGNAERFVKIMEEEIFVSMERLLKILRVNEAKREILRLSDRFSDMVRGKRFLRNRGAVSFFLKDVAENKSRLKV